MKRPTVCGALIGVAVSMAAPIAAQDIPDPERGFARAARSFTACLASMAEASAPSGVDSDQPSCAMQESVFRAAGIRLRIARGQTAEQAAKDTEADIREGRKTVLEGQVSRYALAR